jgi:2-polyprenyl-3-methyl-5-hydroxy-6-metoxy-1,4-benzoquinol methylase
VNERRSSTYALPRGPRDSRSWYLDVDPMSQVDHALVDFVHEHGGHRLLDLGCGTGGYAKVLAERGHEVLALDVNPDYVRVARELGVQADVYDGGALPLADGAVDSVVLLEVLEHLERPAELLAEARRVASLNVLASTPNCTQRFDPVPIEFSHMLDVDHRQRFTLHSLGELFGSVFDEYTVEQAAPLDSMIAALVIARPLRPLQRALERLGLARPRFWSRLLAQGRA